MRTCGVCSCLLAFSALAFAGYATPAPGSESAMLCAWPWQLVWFGLFGVGMTLYYSQQKTEDLTPDKPFAQLFDDLPVPMAIMRISDVTFLSANQEFQRLTRLALADIVGKTHQQVGFDVEPAEQQRFYDFILSQTRVRNYELKMRFGGNQIVLLISSEHVSFNGEPCLLGSFQNITARKQAEERFAKAFHANPISMTILSRRDFRIIETNPSTLKLTGRTFAEMQGKTLRELNVGIAPETWQEIGDQLVATGKLSDYEFKVMYQGRERVLLAGAEHIEFNGEPCILWSQQDITERKRAEERFAKAFYANPLPMCISRASDLRFIAVNESALHSTGYAREEMLGKTRCELGMVGDDLEEQTLLARLKTHGELRDFEVNVTLHGSRHTMLVSVESIVLDGEPCWLWISQDITERKRAEERFTKAFFQNPTPMTISRYADNRHLVVNDSYAQLTGVPKADLIGKTAQELGFVVDPDTSRLFRQSLSETKSVRNFEFEVEYRTGKRTLLVSAELLPLEGELSILWSLLDITERKQAEERFTKAFHANPLPMCILRFDSLEILHANEIFLRRSRLTSAEVRGKIPTEIGFSLDLDKVNAVTDMLRTTGSVRNFEFQSNYQGHDFYFLTNAELMMLDGESSVLWSFQDITERKRAEERFTKAFDATPIPMSITSLRDGRFIAVNDSGLALLGYTRAEVLGKTRKELGRVGNEESEQTLREHVHANHGKVRDFEITQEKPTGARTFLLSSEMITLDKEECLIWTLQDISERKRAEAALQISQTRLRMALDAAALGIWEHDLATNLVHLDEQAQTHFGLATGLPVTEFMSHFHPDDLEASRRVMHEALDPQNTQQQQSLECRWLYLDGTTRWLRFDIYVSFAGEGAARHPIRSLGTSLDITERKQAEEALRASELRYRSLVEDQSEFVARWTPNGMRTFVNDSYCRFFGITREEALRTPWFPESFNQYSQAEMAKLLALTPEQPLHQAEHLTRRKDGQLTWTQWSNRAFFDEAGRIIEYQSVGRDVTERKQTEEALRTSEMRYRRLVEDQLDFLVRWTPDGRRTFVNDSYCRFFGLNPQETLGTSWFELAALSDDDPIRQKLAAISPENPIVEWEHQCFAPDGSTAWTHWINRAFFDDAGRIIEYQSVGRDITERKQAEERFEKAFDANPNPMALLSLPDLKCVQINPARAKLHGVSPQEANGQPFNHLTLWAEADQKAEFFRQFETTGRVRNFEAEALLPTGERRTYLTYAERLTLNGQPHILTSGVDITERKQAEERFAKAFYENATPMSIVRAEGDVIIEVNRAYTALTGWSREEILGKTCTEAGFFITPAELQATLAELRAAGQLNPIELTAVFKTGPKTLLSSASLISFNGEECLLWSEQDITERKQAEEIAQRWQSVFQQTEFGLVHVNITDNTVLDVNEAFAQAHGYTRDEMIGLPVFALYPPDLHAQAQQTYQQIDLLGHSVFETTHIRKSGSPFPVLLDVNVIRDTQGQPRSRIVYALDITERKQSEEIAQRWQSVFSQTEFGLAHTNTADNTYLDVNEAYARMRGYTRAELIGQPVLMIYPSSERERILRVMEEVDRTGHYVFETVHQRKDGSEFPVLMELTVIRNAQGQAVSRISYTTDITERKNAEAALQISEAKFRALAETSQAAILIFDDTQFVYANPACEVLFGYTPAEMIQCTIWDLIHPDSRALAKQRRAARLRGEPIASRNELKARTKSGEARWVDYSLGLIEFGGRPYRIATAFDITERKQVEEDLRTSEVKFRTLAESTQIGISIYDEAGFIYVNPAIERLYGYTREELLRLTWRDLIHPEARPEAEERWQSRQNVGQQYSQGEIRLLNKAGQALWINYSIGTMKFAGQRYVIATSFDITQRKQAEEELRVSEERFAAAFNASPDAMAITTADDGRFVLVNDAWVRIFGVSREAALGQIFQHFNIGFNAEQRNYLFDQVRATGSVVDFEVNIQTISGQSLTLLVTSKLIKLGAETFVLSVSRDTTERKRAEEALRISEERFAAAFNASPDAMSITTFNEGRFVLINDAWVRVFGVSQEAALGQQLNNLNVWMDEKDHHHIFNQVRSAGSIVDYEVTGRTAEGQAITFLITAKLIKLGAETFVLSVIKDITERKHIEVELQNSQSQLRNLAGRLQAVREEERAAIAREIHDELGQALTGIKMDLKWLEQLLPPEAEPARERLTSIYSLIGNTIQSVRQLATSLRPGVLDDFGLAAALEWQARDFTTRTGIACTFDELPEELPLDPAQATALFRIFQETLTNAARHAEATRINARLSYDNNTLRLQIHDNGKGITTDTIKHSRSLGLVGMRERALLLGGTFSIEGGPGIGTTITVQIPTAATPQPGPLTEENTNGSHPNR